MGKKKITTRRLHNHREALKAVKKLTGLVTISKELADEITEKHNGYIYVKKYL